MHGRFWSFFLLFPGPNLPLTDLFLISFLGPQRRSLQTPIHLTQDFPHMTRVIAHPGDAIDELRYAGQRPQLCFPSMGGSPTKKFLLHQRQLFLVQSGLSASPRCAVQRLCIPVVPCQPPLAHALATDPQMLSDAALPLTLLEKDDRFLAAFPQLLEPLFSPLHREYYATKEIPCPEIWRASIRRQLQRFVMRFPALYARMLSRNLPVIYGRPSERRLQRATGRHTLF